MATLTQFANKMSGKTFREALNTNFSNLNNAIKTIDDTVSMNDSDIEQIDNSIKNIENNVENQLNEIQTIQTSLYNTENIVQNLKDGYSKILVSTSNSDNGTVNLPQNKDDNDITVVGQDVFENTTKELNDAIRNIIKGDYLSAGSNIELTKSDSGIVISAVDMGSPNKDWQHSNPNLLINADWRHPSSHRNSWSFIKTDNETETEAKPCIDCWEINYPSVSGAGYTFENSEDNKFVAFQGASPTDPTNLDKYATLSQSFPDNWGDFLIGKKLNLSVAVSSSYSDYQNNIYDIYTYSFTAQQGYTGWMSFPGIENVQFGIHFNTELQDEETHRIENEITVRFYNVWVYAWKLEIGETATLDVDLYEPVDYYKQARDCEKYIQSISSDGTTLSSNEVYIPLTPMILDGVFSFLVPVKSPFMKQPSLYQYINNVQMPIETSSYSLIINGTELALSDIITSIFKYTPGSSNIIVKTSLTAENLVSLAGLTDANEIYSILFAIKTNVILTCEETYNS